MNRLFIKVILIILGSTVILFIGSFFRYLFDSKIFTYIWDLGTVIIFISTLAIIYEIKDLSENTKIGFSFVFVIIFLFLEINFPSILGGLSYLCPKCSVLEGIKFLIM